MNPRPINSIQHAIIDYVWAAAMPILPRWLGWNREATTICDSVAALGAVQSAATDYEAGLVKVLPMQAHLAMDGVIGLSLIGTAALADRQPSSVRLTLLGAGLFALAATALTDPIPTRGSGRTHARQTAARINLTAGERVAAIAGRR